MPEHQQTHQSTESKTTSQRQATLRIPTPFSHPMAIIQRARINPKSLTPADVLQLQRTIGNRAVGRLLSEIRNSSKVQQAPIQRSEVLKEEKEPLQGIFGKEPEEETCPSCVQRQEKPEEEEPLQGKFATIQRREPEDEEKIQMKSVVQRQEISEEEDEPVQGKMIGTIQRQEMPEEEPLHAKRENDTGMPDNLKAGVESLSGIDMSDVKVHYNSSKPAEVGALAYTQGTNIHVAPGQERNLPHEAWHVVQQKQRRVNPTFQINGANINNDNILENEATKMGDAALQKIDSNGTILETSMLRNDGLMVTQPFGEGIWEWIISKIGAMLGLDDLANAVGNSIDEGFAEAMLEIYPPPVPVFKNKVPANLAIEIGKYLSLWKTTHGKPDESFVVCYNVNPEIFKRKILSGQKFLWTYDIDGHLSIGSTQMNQHSVVAAGKDVYAAGTGQLQMSKEMEDYLAYCYIIHVQARKYFHMKEYATAAEYIRFAKGLRNTPPDDTTTGNIVELDFESGHYAPRDAWDMTFKGWSETGFKVIKSTRGGHI